MLLAMPLLLIWIALLVRIAPPATAAAAPAALPALLVLRVRAALGVAWLLEPQLFQKILLVRQMLGGRVVLRILERGFVVLGLVEVIGFFFMRKVIAVIVREILARQRLFGEGFSLRQI